MHHRGDWENLWALVEQNSLQSCVFLEVLVL